MNRNPARSVVAMWMGNVRWSLRVALSLLFGLMVTSSAWSTSFGTDSTDIWWNAKKSGNGYQMIQTGGFIFVTGYLFGIDGQSFWITAELNPSGSFTWDGPVYVTTGPYFGGPFNPAEVESRIAGNMTFTALDVDNGRLDYSVDGIVVSEPVQRQPLTLDNYNGAYVALVTQTTTNCSNPSYNGTGTAVIGAEITQAGSQFTLDTLTEAGGACTTIGTYSQLGRSGTLRGTYSCTSGEIGIALIFEMNNHVHQFNSRFRLTSTNVGCVSSGRITGLIPD